MSIRLNDRVAVVTGASTEPGRSYALLLAERGAKVVVNDHDDASPSDDRVRRAVDAVVAEIIDRQGTAIASYDRVTDPVTAGRVIETALDEFGQIDVLVNSASLLRDKTFAKMDMSDFDAILKRHLLGATYCTRAAWSHMLKQQYGRVVMTTSMAGINGSFGQANFGSAALGLVGLMNTLAKEGRRKNVLVNAISPVVGSWMTEPTMPKDAAPYFRPEHTVAPAVVWFCSEKCTANGLIIQAAGGGFSRVQFFQNEGVFFNALEPITVDMVADAFREITDMSTAAIQPEPLMFVIAKLTAKDSSAQ